MEFKNIQTEKDFLKYLESNVRYGAYDFLINSLRENSKEDIIKALKSFNIKDDDLNKAQEWAKSLINKKFEIIDVTHLLPNIKEIGQISENCLISFGDSIIEGYISLRDYKIYTNKTLYEDEMLKEIKQIWIKKEVICEH